ncbi:Mth938-like domain-containing protein [Lichenifustis flavocetrariae]|uniref:MTH938/NDUFAF3 family protein n=1 Tax=Lichenifustis flavocetrariae TaxID=2949735 RepID=A0AA41YTF1_9HYPH|nr:Mth938-like domain-containing protein [Lichenifustis flavocetrariae]MCW6506697.1 MTH938/NDUFAF3 family protein [Lichenifustis flavocetrariae]
MVEPTGYVPGAHAIDAYGSGAFKFAGMSHRGSILALPTGIHAWGPERFEEIDVASLEALFALPKSTVELLLVGTGNDLVPLPATLRTQLRDAGIRFDPMATGAAARTYNVLMGEGRRVAAALLAVP